MTFYRVRDIELAAVLGTTYDIAFLASGYEERARFLSGVVGNGIIRRVVVVGFESDSDDKERERNDRHFSEKWGTLPQSSSSTDDTVILTALRQLAMSADSHIRILVDYSSMSRLWYSAVLNWARFSVGAGCITVDLCYSLGRYTETADPAVIRDVLAIPGFEGRISRAGRSAAVFGLGFDGFASLCVLDSLEPDVVYSFYADPAASSEYRERVILNNHDMIYNHSRYVLRTPLQSVEKTFRNLAELISPHRNEAGVTLIPMGPKPHVLACMLVCLKHDEVCCLRVSSSRDHTEVVSPTGAVVATRVEFVRKESP